jgi:uncharacterized membrane protein YdfJ with MMPL/SSD domain
MAVGVILDAIAVRSLLVPALVALFGRLGMWPGNRLSSGAARRGGGLAGPQPMSESAGPPAEQRWWLNGGAQ